MVNRWLVVFLSLLIWILSQNITYGQSTISADNNGPSKFTNYLNFDYREKSPFIAVGLNLLYPGLGNMYAGKHVKGTLLFIGYTFVSSQIMGNLYGYEVDSVYFDAFIVILAYGVLSGFSDVNSYNNKLRKKYNVAIIPPTIGTPAIVAFSRRF